MSRSTILGAVFVLIPAVAYAEDPKVAAEHFREGRRAFEAHDYTRAALEFEAANKAKPASAALVSAGLAWELAGDLIHAALDFSSAIDVSGLEPRDEATAREHFAAIEKKLGYLEVLGQSGARLSIDGHEEGVLPLRVRVVPGEHRIEARMSDGTSTERTASVEAGAVVRVDVTPVVERPKPLPSASSLQRTIGWITVGTGAATFVAGAIVGGVGIGVRDQFVSGGSSSAALHDEAIALRTTANVLWATAGVFAIAGVVLVFTVPRARVVIGASGASARVEF